MFVVCNRVSVHPERVAAFEALFLSRAGMVDGMPGFVNFQLMRPAKPTDEYMVMVTWETKEDYHGWLKSQSFKDSHSRTGTLPEDTFLGPQRVELFEVLERTANTA